MSITKDTWAKMLFSKVGLNIRATHRAKRAPNIANGVPNKILKGNDQLSYCADKMRNTNNNEKDNIIINDPDGRVALSPPLDFSDHQQWTTPGGTFDEPGRYLVICTTLPHFAEADMYGWVIVQ